MSETNIFEAGRAIAEPQEAAGKSLKGRLNVYACTPSPTAMTDELREGCLHWIVTIDRDTGVTPMFVKCGNCGRLASSRMYRVDPTLKPTHEWFRPTSADELPEGYSLESVADHVSNGGLLLRAIGDGKWIAPTSEIKAFVDAEQRMYGKRLRLG